MKKLLLIGALLWSPPLLAQEAQNNSNFVAPLGYCQITATGTAALISTCSGGIPARTIWAVICVETANIRWRDDGVAPTASVGMPLGPTAAAACMDYSGTMGAFQIISQTGSPVVNISFYNGAPRS